MGVLCNYDEALRYGAEGPRRAGGYSSYPGRGQITSASEAGYLGHDGDRYEIIHVIYVHGFMDGEVAEWVEQGRLQRLSL